MSNSRRHWRDERPFESEALQHAEDGDVIVMMDADRIHIPSVIVEMASLIESGCDRLCVRGLIGDAHR